MVFLAVLLAVVAVKEFMARRVSVLSEQSHSRALEGDAWHHRSDAIRIIRRSFHENIDGRVDAGIVEEVRTLAADVDGVRATEKCRVRKSGSFYFAEIHVEVDPGATVFTGHEIGHEVKSHLMANMPKLQDAVIHVEPHDGITPSGSSSR